MAYPYYPPPYAYPVYPPNPYPEPESFETRIRLPPIYRRPNYVPMPPVAYEYIPAHWEVYQIDDDPNPPNPEDEKEKEKKDPYDNNNNNYNNNNNTNNVNNNQPITVAGRTAATKNTKTQGVFRPNKQYEITGNTHADIVPQPQFYEHQEPDTVNFNCSDLFQG